MSIALYQRWAGPDRLRLLAAAFDRTTTPVLSWELDGVPVTPTAVMPITSVRPVGPLAFADEPRAFTGLYDIAGVQPNREYRVTLRVDGETTICQARTPPIDIASAGPDGLRVLLVSCYAHDEADGSLPDAVASAVREARPHLVLLMGDQVYLDLPTLQDFKDDEAWLTRNFEAKYVRNWRRRGPGKEAFDAVLSAGPCVSLPDDHEYWNNAPHLSAFLQNTWTAEGRARWKRAAECCLNAFQTPDPAHLGAPLRIDLAPLSIVLADGRSQRREVGAKKYMFRDDFPAWLRAWVAEINGKGWNGAFVSGQSMFRAPAGRIDGKIADWEMPNYDDFTAVAEALAGVRRDLLCITGDVHWGRVLHAIDTFGIANIHEVVTSPATLVTTVGVDQGKKSWNWVRGLFGGRSDPWPRHSAADEPPTFFANDVVGVPSLSKRYATQVTHRQRGDQIAMLTMHMNSGRLQADVRYIPVTFQRQPTVEVAIFPPRS